MSRYTGYILPVTLIQDNSGHCFIADFNHFEIEVIDDFGGTNPPPPVIALTSASPKDNLPTENMSNYKIDYLRFWAVGEGKDVLITHGQSFLYFTEFIILWVLFKCYCINFSE